MIISLQNCRHSARLDAIEKRSLKQLVGGNSWPIFYFSSNLSINFEEICVVRWKLFFLLSVVLMQIVKKVDIFANYIFTLKWKLWEKWYAIIQISDSIFFINFLNNDMNFPVWIFEGIETYFFSFNFPWVTSSVMLMMKIFHPIFVYNFITRLYK